jgi:5-methylcytosine-specific restriction endonuclease McrA
MYKFFIHATNVIKFFGFGIKIDYSSKKIKKMSGVLVLNYDYTHLNITSTRRGFILVDKGKAEIIKSDETPIAGGYNNYVRPLIIRLLSYIKFHTRLIRVNRSRIYKRDNHQCVYCDSKKQLTLDHVIPKSRGGSNDWTNLVTCCFKCNLKKGNRTPEEAKMTMSVKPFVPSLLNDNGALNKIWNDYQNSFV